MKLIKLFSFLFVILFASFNTARAQCSGVSGQLIVEGYNNLDGGFYQFCLGDDVTLLVQDLVLPDGAELYNYSWSFSNFLFVESPLPEITYSNLSSGVYEVSLSISQDGCETVLDLDFPVSIAQYPVPIVPAESGSCIGDEGLLVGSFSQNYIGVDFNVVNDTVVHIQDLETYIFPLEVTGAIEGAVITSCEDFGSAFLNLIHSWMEDLIITLTCPNGQEVILHNQGGSAVDFGEFINTPPYYIGYDYWWDMDSPLGTIPDNAMSGPLPSGSYLPYGDLCDLVGCPVNGTWTYTISDVLYVDYGFVYQYGVNINSELFGQYQIYEPTIGMDADSSYWQGPGLVSFDLDADSIFIIGTEVGDFTYEYVVTNSAGCTSIGTTQYEVSEVSEGLFADAGEDFISSIYGNSVNGAVGISNECGDEIQVSDICLGDNAQLEVTYCSQEDFNCDGQLYISFTEGYMENLVDFIYVYDGPSSEYPLIGQFTGGLSSDEAFGSSSGGCITLVFYTNESYSCELDFDVPISYQVQAFSNGYPESYWTPENYVSNYLNLTTGIISLLPSEEFVLHAYSTFHPFCEVTDTVVAQLNQNRVQGYVFHDLNANGLLDENEPGLADYNIHLNSFTLSTDEDGMFNLYGDIGPNTMTLYYDQSVWQTSTSDVFNFILNEGESTSEFNFGLIPLDQVFNVQGYVLGNIGGCNDTSELIFLATNQGNQIASGSVSIQIDPLLNVISISETPLSQIANSFEFGYENLSPGMSKSFVFQLQNPGSASDGSILSNSISTYVLNENTSILNSFQPNLQTMSCATESLFKQETTGTGVDHAVIQNSELIYLISFQNNQSVSSPHVVIYDYLDASLDASTLQVLGSSHPVTYYISEDGWVRFLFQGINLAGANTEPGSGYVQFKITQNLDVPVGTIIYNYAEVKLGIYGEFEPTNTTFNLVQGCEDPGFEIIHSVDDLTLFYTNFENGVIDWYFNGELLFTNTPSIQIDEYGVLYAVVHTLEGCEFQSESIFTNVQDLTSNFNIDIWPNPASNTIQWDPHSEFKSLTVFDITGMKVLETSDINHSQLNIEHFAPGLYYVTFSGDKQVLFSKPFQKVD